MKIALCQINTIVGNFAYNQQKILKYYNNSIELNANIIAFPELVISGYPPQDLILLDSFINKNLEVLDIISKKTTIPMIIGYIRKENDNLYNSAAVCYDGKLQDSYDKVLLPTYDVFDEGRYFTSGQTPTITKVPIKDKELKIGVQICEDMWDDVYDCKVSKSQMNLGAEFIVNISASPYQVDRLKKRKEVIIDKIEETELPFLYCNAIGGQDELIFDGQSMAFSSEGALIAYGEAFKEEIVMVNLESKTNINIKMQSKEEKMYNALCLGLSDYFVKTGHSEAVIGLSGGIDSALVASIANDALGSSKVHGISLPSKYSSDHSLVDARELANNLGIDYRIISIQNAVDQIESLLHPHFLEMERDITEENIQARVRGDLLMALSNKFGWMVLSTGNKTEIALGYCTLYGDMNGGLSVIADLGKSDVYALSNWINTMHPLRIPLSTINKPPSAELAPNQVDPFDYNIVSPLVDKMIAADKTLDEIVQSGVNQELVSRLYNKIRINEYKRRQSAPGLRVSSKAFGFGRRFPIVNHFKPE